MTVTVNHVEIEGIDEMLNILLDYGGKGEGRLYVRKSNGAVVYINCVYSAGMNIVEEYQKLHLFTVEFFAADPNFYVRQTHPFTEISSSPYTLTINNPNLTPMYVSMLLGKHGEIYTSWNIEGGLENTTTGKKITFNEISVANGLQLFISLNPSATM